MPSMADFKTDANEIERRASDGELHDKDLVGEKAKADAEHYGHLSEEELVLEKKLRRKIDMVIMPTVILVYLMNYIGECSPSVKNGEAEGG